MNDQPASGNIENCREPTLPSKEAPDFSETRRNAGWQGVSGSQSAIKSNRPKNEAAAQENTTKRKKRKCKFGIIFAGVASVAACVSAGLMLAQLSILKRFSVSEQRAYVFIEEAAFEGVDTEFPFFRIKVRNFGHTPAYKLAYWARADAFPYPAQLPDRRPSSLSNSVIPPATFVTDKKTVGHSINKAEWELIRRGEAAVYLWGEFIYENAFEEKCVTSFKLLIGGDAGLSSNIVYHDKKGNNEECQKP